mmetsp:Transcript_4470/g.5797  ORF Transcript_4470/g.5797 Transcript_4470/m.5797 type:complete len:208 (-) Transcript_4470:201-824(-)
MDAIYERFQYSTSSNVSTRAPPGDTMMNQGEYPEPYKWPLDVQLPTDAQFHPLYFILSRRLNLQAFPEDTSLYSLLRAWMQDDPTKPSLPEPAAVPEAGLDSTLMTAGPLPKEKEKELPPNSCTEDLLKSHISRAKKVKKWFQKSRAHRYQRFKSRLDLLGVPESAQIQKCLSDCEPQKKKQRREKKNSFETKEATKASSRSEDSIR